MVRRPDVGVKWMIGIGLGVQMIVNNTMGLWC